jgi:hypothetical protein
MAIVEDHEIKLTDKQGFTMARYSKGDEYFRLQDGAHTTSFATFEAADLIAFLERVRDMQDDDRPSGTCVYAGTQRDYGDERPDDDGFITTHPRPRRDGPGLDVKALADLEGRN